MRWIQLLKPCLPKLTLLLPGQLQQTARPQQHSPRLPRRQSQLRVPYRLHRPGPSSILARARSRKTTQHHAAPTQLQ